MREPLTSLFETLEPPRGGLAGLRSRLERERRRRSRLLGLRLATVTSMVGGLVLFGLLAGAGGEAAPLDAEQLRMRLGLAPVPSEPLRIHPAQRQWQAAMRVPVDRDDVILYLVASREAVEEVPEPEPGDL